jgi:glycosyltransferase involved in cell wall biosynthesis
VALLDQVFRNARVLMDKLSHGLSIVIPVYNSAESLPHLAARIEPALKALRRPFEAILINDGSSDGSWEAVQRLAGEHRWITGINLMRNYGQHNALLCGIRAARFDTVVTMDDDLQNPPEEIGKLLAKLDEGFDVVYGTPLTEQHGLWRDLSSWITKLALQRVAGAEVARHVSAFRSFRTGLRQAFANYRSPYISIDVLLTWATTRFAAIPVEHNARRLGRSNYTFLKLVTHALNMLTGYSTAPLRLATLVGFGFTIFGIAVLGYVVGRYLAFGTIVPGFSFLASVIAIFSGAQLFALGIMGEYLSRIHFRTMDRPSYVIRSLSANRQGEHN